MSEIPKHPDSSEPGGSKRRPVKVIVGIVAALGAIVAFAALHLSGVLGPGQH